MGTGTCSMYAIWDGVWELVNGNHTFTGTKTNHVRLDFKATYLELLEKAYEVTGLNRDEFDIEMTWWGEIRSKSLVVPVKNEDDVETLISFNTESRCSVPLCLVSKKKAEMRKEPRESHNSNSNIPVVLGLAEEAVLGSADQVGLGSANQSTVRPAQQNVVGSAEPTAECAAERAAEQSGYGSAEQDLLRPAVVPYSLIDELPPINYGNEDWHYNDLDEEMEIDPFFMDNDDDEPMFESSTQAMRISNEVIQESLPDNTVFVPIVEADERANVNETDETGTSEPNIRKRKETSGSDACSSPPVGNALFLNQVFNGRTELSQHLKNIAILKNKEIRTKKCDKSKFVVVCRDEKCPWRVRACPISKSCLWVVKKYNDIHTCSVDLSKHNHRNASDLFVSELIKERYSNPTHVFPPAAIISEVKKSLHIDINYHKAWRAKEKAINSVMGTPNESFAKLPAYLHRLKEVNPGTITHIESAEDGHFRYCFMSLGASIRGFLGNIRPVIAIDGTFLRGKYGGTLLLATAMDGNKQIYPIAFGIVDSENNESWNWFLVKLHEIIGHMPDLVIISDRHKSIMKGVADVFPDAVHGICLFHLKMNVAAKFKKVDVAALLFKAGKTYDEAEHKSCMNGILGADPRVYNYLTVEAKVEQWARVYFTGHRYSIMTTNIAESMNSVLRKVREYPPVSLLDTIVTKLSMWYAKRREIALKMQGPLTTWAEKKIVKADELSRSYNVRQLDGSSFHVMDGRKNPVVDLKVRTCSCRRFQLDKIPCSHAIAAAAKKGVSKFELAHPYYSSEYLLLAYAETIMPVEHEDEWQTPAEISNETLLFPIKRRAIGRPGGTSRILSQGEEPPLIKTCGKCKKKGHNRRTCKNPANQND
ncbi:hypothetical protein CASFOL_000010 [Castilleja foliolosa]|uniref:SWIM-type domain-containing protein n=1 Tax=Castilleja foliolosa TaxID=1961234 RepID=A0ABD3ER58_9LAMI